MNKILLLVSTVVAISSIIAVDSQAAVAATENENTAKFLKVKAEESPDNDVFSRNASNPNTGDDQMIKLYGGKRSRASIVQWYLEELSLPYEFILLDMAAGEHQQPDYLNINPMGKVPAIEDGAVTIWESGAILLYLAEKYGNPNASLEERSIWMQWVLFANSTLATGLFVEANRDKEVPKLLTALSEILSTNPYILGEDFTVADVAVGSILAYVPMMLPIDLSPYPVILNYIKQINQRPAFQKTIGKR